jgi:hypothetical protein
METLQKTRLSSRSSIESARGYLRFSNVGNLMILNGNITLHGSRDNFGIGSGLGDMGSSIIQNLIIANGNIPTSSSLDGSGIGVGRQWQS